MLLSIVLPVYGVEGYLAECLDSILAEPAVEFEVVAVDDASPDGCGRLLDDYADRDARVRVVHLAGNGGLGPAREIGLARARGEYVWFVDSDDRLTEGALAAVASHLTRIRPDVLVCDFANAYPGGVIERERWHRLFRDPPPEVFTLSERPSLLRLGMAAWNKVIRREFLLGLGVRFGPGFYEDISVTYPILLAADRLALLDRVCYHYRRERGGAITETRSDRHFDLFAQYAAIFAFIEGHGTEALRTAVFERTVRKSTTVFDSRGLLPAKRRREFFHQMSLHFRRFRPEGYAHPGGVRGIQYRLVEHDAYTPYLLLRKLARARIALCAAVPH